MENAANKTKITIIDDNEELVDTMRHFLEMRNFSVTAAYGGKSGLDVIKQEKPDVIILDITMPDMDGRDVLLKMKNDDEINKIPVILLTARVEQFDRAYGLELGATEYVTKPYDGPVLLRHIEIALKKKK